MRIRSVLIGLAVLGFGAPSAFAQFLCVEDVTVHPVSNITIDDTVVLNVSLFGERTCIVFRPIEVAVVDNKFVVEIPVEESDSDCEDIGPLTRTIELGKLGPGAYEYSVEAKGSAVCHLCDCFASGNFSVGAGACCIDGQCQEVMRTVCIQRGGIFAGDGIECSNIDCATLIPAVSDWGMVVVTLLVLTVGKVVFGRRTAA
ncbi:MAG: hypothetical protein JSU63_01370 [Phycisphaerales bacterium]|nr:MAG: hypothetical protein JSU63_01370 [Phycisphaerales bacterium]